MLLFTAKSTGKEENPCYQVQILHGDNPTNDGGLFSKWAWVTEEFTKYCTRAGMNCKAHKFGGEYGEVTIYFHDVTFYDIMCTAEDFCHSRKETFGMVQI